MTTIFIPDTNVVLKDPFVTRLLSNELSQTIILKAVMNELDLLKSNENGRIARQARAVSRDIEQMSQECPKTGDGWLIRENPASFFTIDEDTDRSLRPPDRHSFDDRILACATIHARQAARVGNQVALVTNDRNMRLLAANRGISTINPSELINTAPGCYMLPTVSTLYEQKAFAYPLELGDGNSWYLETVPGQEKAYALRRQAIYVRLLSPGDTPNTQPPWMLPDTIPLLAIWASIDQLSNDDSPYSPVRRASFHPEANEGVLYYHGWRMHVILHGSMLEDHPTQHFVHYYFHRLALEIHLSRMTPEEIEAKQVYEAECRQREIEWYQQIYREAERREKERLESIKQKPEEKVHSETIQTIQHKAAQPLKISDLWPILIIIVAIIVAAIAPVIIIIAFSIFKVLIEFLLKLL